MTSTCRILFVSRHNSVRAPLAAALAQAIAGPAVATMSAGPEPEPIADHVHSLIDKLNPESPRQSLSISDVADTEFDMVITLCDKSHAALPEHPGDRLHLRWDIHRAENAEELRHLEIELAERLRLMLLAQHLIS
eukprot:Anaeramoba_flamelloidesa850808_18.p1 GENE.a850808_18~~a850808_18.p1  ORF type:complete len:135 (-),score=2.62 a850808_18:126-530(-)